MFEFHKMITRARAGGKLEVIARKKFYGPVDFKELDKEARATAPDGTSIEDPFRLKKLNRTDDFESKKSTKSRGTTRLLVMAYFLSISLKIMSSFYSLHRLSRLAAPRRKRTRC
jgi:hypothetical protein